MHPFLNLTSAVQTLLVALANGERLCTTFGKRCTSSRIPDSQYPDTHRRMGRTRHHSNSKNSCSNSLSDRSCIHGRCCSHKYTQLLRTSTMGDRESRKCRSNAFVPGGYSNNIRSERRHALALILSHLGEASRARWPQRQQ